MLAKEGVQIKKISQPEVDTTDRLQSGPMPLNLILLDC
jgi:hypothetical protein